MRRRELRGAEKRTKGCGEEKTLYFGATVCDTIFVMAYRKNHTVRPRQQHGASSTKFYVQCWEHPSKALHGFYKML